MNDRTAGARGLVRRLGGRLRATLAPRPAQQKTGGSGRSTARDRQAQLAAELAEVQQAARAASEQLDELTAERDRLREERLTVQQELGAQHDQRVLPRLRVEKTNGVASFVVGQRMMQRIHRRAADPAAGLDGVGAVFADPEQTARFARSHGVPVAEADEVGRDGAGLVVHAFKGEVGLVELRGADGVRHLTADGTDPGDVRPATTYDPDLPAPAGLEQICAWSAVLSAAVPRPYVQLRWSDGPEPRLVGIDVDPDRIPVLTPEWDQRLGKAFDEAYARMLMQPFRGGGLDNRVPGGTFSYEERV